MTSIIRTLHGLPWEIVSPSYYRLAKPAVKEGSALDVSYLEAGEWMLFLDHNGNISSQLFPTRDDAMGMVAEAFMQPIIQQ